MKKIALISAATLVLTASLATAQNRYTPGVFMEIMGSAHAYEELCDNLVIDEDVMQQAAMVNNITQMVFDDAGNQARFTGQYQRMIQSAESYTDRDFFCDNGLVEFGKDGVNFPGLLKQKN
ncbi:hypothetical protein [Martelella mediterranea]|uniref:Uncharacterized protein n=1 Tax=Martelella mediterranea TaxID=293089 RepID=A0A4R3NS36_9HYPH|nr:hypothetical protein [Martelella mediterranea]TCT39606.1 hypothetical protein EDC90_1012104 [Martelella mediterranea]